MSYSPARATEEINAAEPKSSAGSTSPVQMALDASPRLADQQRQQQAIDASPRQQEQGALVSRLPAANRTGLPDALKAGVENLSGHSLDDVRVHYNSSKPAQLQAHAYAQGTDIHLAPGQEQHLPHEAWHVVQQKQGRVQPTIQMKAADARQYIEEKKLGISATKQDVLGYIQNTSNPKRHRDSLLKKWNKGYSPVGNLYIDIKKGSGPNKRKRKKGRQQTEPKTAKKRTAVKRYLDDFTVLKMDDEYELPLNEVDAQDLESEEESQSSSDEELGKPKAKKRKIEQEDEEDEEYSESDEDVRMEHEAAEKEEDEFSRMLDEAEGVTPRMGVNDKWSDRDPLRLATLNLDHYSGGKSSAKSEPDRLTKGGMGKVMSVKKNDLRMREIVYLLSTNNPDILVIQEIQGFAEFKAEFNRQLFSVAHENDEGIFVTGLDQLQKERDKSIKLKVASQYQVIEQPTWKAGTFSEKNAIIINSAVISPSDEMYRYDTREGLEDASLEEVDPTDILPFGEVKKKGSKNYQARDPIITNLTYLAGTPKERKLAVINVHTNPTGSSKGAPMKQQNQTILKALEAARKTNKYDAVFAIGDFYMENADTKTFNQLIRGEYEDDDEKTLATPRTTFATNNPNAHPEGYQFHHHRMDESDDSKPYKREEQETPILNEARKKAHKGQKADMLIYYTDLFLPEENAPNTFPPMYPPGADEEEVRGIREARFDTDSTDNRFIKSKAKLREEQYERTVLASEDGEELDIQTEKLYLTEAEVSAWRKPAPDHAFRLFTGYLKNKVPPKKQATTKKKATTKKAVDLPRRVRRKSAVQADETLLALRSAFPVFTAIEERDEEDLHLALRGLQEDGQLDLLRGQLNTDGLAIIKELLNDDDLYAEVYEAVTG
ncbi:eCIS core domain-containing protein [Hymenobacter pini]|uniref:eCIS core domain-containing protein n=1 Tax=Hymenobacter pini TaxID=2880879 RepID=UPI001CF3615B|nr:DUF4157 domain-containing protein [Hymenobacter pini]MCA8830315.1 DUF4157 domain-containing protein [Hymenobacter pini]